MLEMKCEEDVVLTWSSNVSQCSCVMSVTTRPGAVGVPLWSWLQRWEKKLAEVLDMPSVFRDPLYLREIGSFKGGMRSRYLACKHIQHLLLST